MYIYSLTNLEIGKKRSKVGNQVQDQNQKSAIFGYVDVVKVSSPLRKPSRPLLFLIHRDHSQAQPLFIFWHK